jgi:hypothetical protein
MRSSRPNASVTGAQDPSHAGACRSHRGDQHQFMTKIIREPRLVIRMSDPLLAVLEAAGVAEGRTAAG